MLVSAALLPKSGSEDEKIEKAKEHRRFSPTPLSLSLSLSLLLLPLYLPLCVCAFGCAFAFFFVFFLFCFPEYFAFAILFFFWCTSLSCCEVTQDVVSPPSLSLFLCWLCSFNCCFFCLFFVSHFFFICMAGGCSGDAETAQRSSSHSPYTCTPLSLLS